MAYDREVAGLRCSQVLDELSDYLDGALPPERVRQIEAHRNGCDWCERFGGRFRSAVGLLRQELTSAPAVSRELRTRLRERIRREQQGE